MAHLLRPAKFEVKLQRLQLGNELVQSLASATGITSLSDLKKGDLLVKESLNVQDEDNEAIIRVP